VVSTSRQLERKIGNTVRRNRYESKEEMIRSPSSFRKLQSNAAISILEMLI
jgi:hypothetical protein